jgi:hypothetical protein
MNFPRGIGRGYPYVRSKEIGGESNEKQKQTKAI